MITLSTFHYGSIKIRYELFLKGLATGSTFHYGSIKIHITEETLKIVLESTFHYGSIKIIFFNAFLDPRFIIYIPLWFY